MWDAYDTTSRCTPVCGVNGAGISFNNDVNGHGSHCAGTVGGLSTGVAPSASLFGLKVSRVVLF
jgi:subtilisin family serine protease